MMRHRSAIRADAEHIYATSLDDIHRRGDWSGLQARMQYVMLEVLLDIREIAADQAGYIIPLPEDTEPSAGKAGPKAGSTSARRACSWLTS